ncbi:hypothetical protein Tco_0759641 [Tanacetum coccineum]
MKETPYELLEDDKKKKIGKNNEAKMTLYNAIPHKDFTMFNAIVTSIKSLDPNYSSKNHVRRVLHALQLKWRAKDLRPPKKRETQAKVIREQTSDDSNSQGGSNEDIDEEEAEAYNLLARNFPSRKKVVKAQRKEELATIAGYKATLQKLANDKEVLEPCKTCDVLTKEVDSLKCNVSKLQDEALNFSKFKDSSITLDDMLSRQKLSQDKEGLGFSKNDKTSFVFLKCDILLDDCIMDSGCTKHVIGNIRLFTSYKVYDGGHVIFRRNLKRKVIDRDMEDPWLGMKGTSGLEDEDEEDEDEDKDELKD